MVRLNKPNSHTTSLNFVTSGNNVEVLIGDAIFLEFILHEATYKVGRIDWRIHLAHKIGQGTDMVFMTMGNSPHLILIFNKVGHIRDNDIHAV